MTAWHTKTLETPLQRLYIRVGAIGAARCIRPVPADFMLSAVQRSGFPK